VIFSFLSVRYRKYLYSSVEILKITETNADLMDPYSNRGSTSSEIFAGKIRATDKFSAEFTFRSECSLFRYL